MAALRPKQRRRKGGSGAVGAACATPPSRGLRSTQGSRRHVDAYLERLARAFRHALSNGQRAGDIHNPADLDELAAFFTTALIAIAACIRAEAPPQQLRTASSATSVLDAHLPRRSAESLVVS